MNKVFELTNKYIILGTPLILFSLLSSIFLAVTLRGAVINILIALALFALMSAAFIAGWFNMVKNAVLNPDEDDVNSLIKNFTPGVGEYFLSALGSIFIIVLVSLVFILLATFIGAKLIGDPGIPSDAFNAAMQNQESLQVFLASLTKEQLIKINSWNLLLLLTIVVTYFLEILYLPAMFFKNKNPFVAFWINLKDLFSRKFFKTLGIYLAIFFANFVISILAALFAGNLVLHFIMTLLNFYFVTFVAVGVFYYYNNNFIKPQLGQNIDKTV